MGRWRCERWRWGCEEGEVEVKWCGGGGVRCEEVGADPKIMIMHAYRIVCYLSDSEKIIILGNVRHNYIRSKLSQLTVRY